MTLNFEPRTPPIFGPGSILYQIWKGMRGRSFLHIFVKIGSLVREKKRLFNPPGHAHFWSQCHHFIKSENTSHIWSQCHHFIKSENTSHRDHNCEGWWVSVQWFERRRCLKMWTDVRTTTKDEKAVTIQMRWKHIVSHMHAHLHGFELFTLCVKVLLRISVKQKYYDMRQLCITISVKLVITICVDCITLCVSITLCVKSYYDISQYYVMRMLLRYESLHTTEIANYPHIHRSQRSGPCYTFDYYSIACSDSR